MDRGLDVFNTLPADDVRELLLSCCAAPGWAAAVAAGRPYADRAALTAAGRARIGALPWPEVVGAVAAHPRIGRPPTGTGRDAEWSRREQAAATAASGTAASAAGTVASGPGVATELAEVNDAYEQRFGYRFLIFANGRSAAELVAAARQRLHHDPDTEQGVVRTELGDIAALRLGRLVDDMAAPAPLSSHVLDTTTGTPAAGIAVRLDAADPEGGWRTVATGHTDADGRLRDWVPGAGWAAGTYRLVFDVADRLGADAFYTEIPVVFTVRDAARHHHVPLLLSPYGYTTYRGS
ncbi:2-oxo-4-hydroxy-4-carboxy-5-ureidoimidazoline decarboxylase [Solwaraspora sp. WMMD937]|uniref:2-oxo-4-hydroxy-4-carboxy-5-ureidoimidazoline decarboxylase n=1 Tax=Solwaraspora sp. WMMD937 TaxID=3016090 RepID=UPI00249AC7B9|nr:2-oxo-4-hydroxy-4-carboxy-5-ureidoimidazoline decarboxylase [Solwaraspora sp. WMMD937]WFE20472.1 2-oxo-4-hydroxy-4-carboxy-5-ureidoimidazoline decarboxylase [Solwaraspora sp. WMMD937]